MTSVKSLPINIADFKVVREIGRGATAIVYECTRLDETFAVKCMLFKENQDKVRESINFRKEAAILSKVDHPSLVRLIEVGEHNGQPFIAMELVRGGHLRETFQQSLIPEPTLIKLLLSVARGLAYIHRLGFVHRDMKPENILINENNEVKIIDFGFARSKDFSNAATEEAAGTILYTAPEIIRGESSDSRCDLYSLGIMAFEFLTGQPPYKMDSRSLANIHNGIVPLIVSLKPDVNPALAAIVHKLISPSADDRYQSAEGLVADLEKIDELAAQWTKGNLHLDQTSKLVKVSYEVPLVGRESELAQLVQLWRKCRSGQGNIVQIEGEGGSGKSRLTQELMNICREEGFLLLRGKCQENDITPMAVLRQCLDDYVLRLNNLPDGQRDAAITFLRKAAGHNAPVIKRVSSGMAKIFADISDEALVDAVTERQRLLASMSQILLELAAGPVPLLLMIDDSQWIDALSLEILKQVATKMKSYRLMILSAARNDEDSMVAATRFIEELGGKDALRIVLKPLDIQAIHKFAKSLLGGRELSNEVIEKLSHITKGNIFALREYILSMLEQGILTPVANGWVVNMEQFNELAVSGNVLQLIVNRLKYLSSDAAHVLAIGSIIGMSFNRQLLALVSRRSQKEVDQIVKEASLVNLVDVSDEAASFVHDRIREALAQSFGKDETRDVHQSIADVLDQQNSNSAESVFAQAQHYILGRPEKNYSRAFNSTYRAGQLALENFANTQAYELLNQALQYREHCKDSHITPDQLYEAIGLTYFRLGKMDLAFDNFSRALKETKNSNRIGEVTASICEALDSLGLYDPTPSNQGAFKFLEMGLASMSMAVPKSKLLILLSVISCWFRSFLMMRFGFGFGGAKEKDKIKLKTLAKLFEIGTLMSFREGRVVNMVYYSVLNLYYSQRLGATREAAVAIHLYCWLAGVLGFKNAALNAGHRAVAISEQIGDRPALLLSRVYLCMAMIVLNCRKEYDELSKTTYDDMRRFLPGHRSTAYSPVGHFHHLHLKGHTREFLAWAMERYPLLEKFGNMNFLMKSNTLIYSDAVISGRSDIAQEMLESRERMFVRGVRDFIIPIKNLMVLVGDTHIGYAKGSVDPATVDKLTEEIFGMSAARGMSLVSFYFREFPMMAAYGNRLLLLSDDPTLQEKARKNLSRLFSRFGKVRFFLKKTAVHRAHYHIILSAIEQDKGRLQKAIQYLALAEKDAQEADSDWAQFEILRERARICLRVGKNSEANQLANAALGIAIRQNWVLYQNTIRTEFNLQADSKSVETSKLGIPDESELNHYLDSLLRVGLASAATINPEEQARAALDELIKVLNADRAFLFRSKDNSIDDLLMHAGRDSEGHDLTELKGYSSTVVKLACRDKKAMMVNSTEEGRLLGSESAILHNLRSIMAAPMIIQDSLIGVVYIDSKASHGMFTEDDLRFFEAIVNHIAIAIKLSIMAESEVKRRSLEKDMELASVVQSLFLPVKRELNSKTFNVASAYDAATHVSGDWWWYEHSDETGISVFLGDVTGHGAAPAMLTASICSQYRLLRKTKPNDSIRDVMMNLNEEFTMISRGDYLMTMAGVHVNNEGVVSLWNAAGPQVMIVRQDNEIEDIMARGSALGMEEFEVGFCDARLNPGDRLVFATDGLFEMDLTNENQIKHRQIKSLLKKVKDMKTKEAIDLFVLELKNLRGTTPLKDDVTIIFADFKPDGIKLVRTSQ